MGKKLSDMTLEELWHLFPIILTAHRDEWAQWYEEEKVILTSLLPPSPVMHHVGNTAIRGIWAKPIVDILVVLPDASALRAAKDVLTAAGYLCMSESGTRISLNKGYTETGFAERVFHIHLRLPGDDDEVTFRDYLNVHPDDARAYEALKLRLWHPYEHDRDGYTAAKTDFVQRIMRAARASEEPL